jgi:hypothetical protein
MFYWFHRYNDVLGFCSDFIVEYSQEFLNYFPDVQPPNDTLIKYDDKAKHNLLISFKSSDDFSLSKKEIPYFFILVRPTYKEVDEEEEKTGDAAKEQTHDK